MHLEATTRIDYDTYRKYYLFNFLQGKRSPWQARLLIIIAPLLFLVFLYLYWKNPTDIFNLVAVLIMLLLGVMLVLIVMLVPRRYFMSVERLIQMPNFYIFDDEQFTVSSQPLPNECATSTPYAKIYRIYETKNYFYIYLSRSQAFILGKYDFTQGSAAELSQWLADKLGGRFISPGRKPAIEAVIRR
jgi:Mn2+/Fe2+ NRAMP family transporter